MIHRHCQMGMVILERGIAQQVVGSLVLVAETLSKHTTVMGLILPILFLLACTLQQAQQRGRWRLT
jgi:hypothetical protein